MRIHLAASGHRRRLAPETIPFSPPSIEARWLAKRATQSKAAPTPKSSADVYCKFCPATLVGIYRRLQISASTPYRRRVRMTRMELEHRQAATQPIRG
jgi:hypothetical protein